LKCGGTIAWEEKRLGLSLTPCPALRYIVSKQEFAALGEDFEKKEHQLFGEGGFEKIVERIATIERTLGIYDLAQFTPHA
jgi:hypothetical protein